MAAGTPKEVMNNPKSLTGQYLSGKKIVPVPLERRKGSGNKITVTGAAENNLKDISVDFPLGKFVVVTGVSGSGKSTLVNLILKRALAQKLNNNSAKPGKYKSIKGYKNIEKIIDIDQSPIDELRVVIQQLILVYLTIFELYLHKLMKLRCVDILRLDSLLTLREDAVRRVMVMELSKLK